MAKKKASAKGKKLGRGKKLEQQKPLLTVKLEPVTISGHSLSSGGGGSTGN